MQKIDQPLSYFEDDQSHLLAALNIVDLRIRWAVARARGNGLDPHDEFLGLYISDEQIDKLLQFSLGQHSWSYSNLNGANGHDGNWENKINNAWLRWYEQSDTGQVAGKFLRLNHFRQAFDLTPVELEAFLLTLAPEIDPRFASVYAYLQDDVTKKRPSVNLILNLLTDDFDQKLRLRRLFWKNGRLGKHYLWEVGKSDDGVALLSEPVRPVTHIVEYLLGNNWLDRRIADYAQLLFPETAFEQRRVPSDLIEKLERPLQSGISPLFAFYGPWGSGRQEAARFLAVRQNSPLLIVDLASLANEPAELNEAFHFVLRDGRMYEATLYLHNWDALLTDGSPNQHILNALLNYPHMVIVGGQAVWHPSSHLHSRPIFPISFLTPAFERRLQLWQAHLGKRPDLDLISVANQFRFTPGQIEDSIATAIDLARWRGEGMTSDDLFAACRMHSNQNLANLATKITPRYGWEDIVLPPDTAGQLEEMVNMVRKRPMVYGSWGFDRKLALGKGLSALFAGESGTGKTMAADVMAGELGLDLYKIDLSTVVSKYIGETEKNLDRIFTEAATSNAILFFDEADAIFGKRSEVKDSHDRYANIEISYLLQRMESYDGVVILATNLRSNLDEAFTRRLHFVIEFPVPELADRERIWKVNFPKETPISESVDFHLLAERYAVTGGNIRNMILAGAFLAAEKDSVVDMSHLMHAARREYQKMGRLLDEKLFKLPEYKN